MKFNFRNKKISGILTVIPKNEVRFDDEAPAFQSTPKQMKRLKQVMGFDRRRLTDIETSFLDLATFGAKKIFSEGLVKREDIGALIVVTHHPDYFTPPTSNIIQGSLDLSSDVYCLDINDGCSGYVIGLIQAFQLLEHMTKKILLIVGMVRSKRLATDLNRSSLLWGDAVSLSVVENDPAKTAGEIFAEVKIFGRKWDAIRRPADGLRKIFSAKDAYYITDTVMNGGEVFQFTQLDVPTLIRDVLSCSGKSLSEFDWFLFHQPNKLLIEKLVEELNLPPDKTPDNVVSQFGNSSSATIPTNICLNLAPEILHRSFNVCMSGFGTGLTVGAMTMKLGALDFCAFAEY